MDATWCRVFAFKETVTVVPTGTLHMTAGVKLRVESFIFFECNLKGLLFVLD